MKRKELIKIAKTCSAGNCDKSCPLKPDDMQAIDATIACQEDLIALLATELEKSTLVITVKKGKTNENK